MVDLEKEREAFESVYHVDGLEVEHRWDAWLERAELAQHEISHLKNANHHLNEINEDISNTILYLREKLAKYESDDVVLVPREPSDEMIDKGEWQLLDLNENVDLIYKDMIEAGEIK